MIEDVDVAMDTSTAQQAAGRLGFHADGVELMITGVCGRCAALPGGAP